ncbi:sigma factor G inhibitor Gin [Pseudogracilibacillus auburnensis]|uniref:sigma factor G inhibitor Gin n=1 Tax=Pseudogracilibacillus auburnensis TaxID=1494959 RepID=UPI001A970311|nr:sigma factor G inhibitor Gin [Pseudogracilibacillus auburnensis]MBO1004747.1 sigma factor G inhibitor Gin [Pseudogracilibacillus auburnensis]
MEKCIVCEEPRQHGIHLYTSFICTSCEEAMIHTSTKDPVYKHYVKQLRVIKESKILS